MQDVRTKQLKVASFRGFIFLCPEESVPSVGRKIVKHDYPNSGKRFAQDLGPLPSDFDVTAVITGDNFLQKAINFERILNKRDWAVGVTAPRNFRCSGSAIRKKL